MTSRSSSCIASIDADAGRLLARGEVAVAADLGGLVLPLGLGLEDPDEQHLLVHREQVGIGGRNGQGSGLLEETGVLRADARHLLQDVA